MKVVLFSVSFIDEVIIDMANSLSESIKVVLMIPANHIKKNRIDLISPKVVFEPYYMPRTRSPSCLRMMYKIAKRINYHDPDVIHIQDHGHAWFFVAFPFLKKYPFVNTIHDPEIHLGDKLKKGFRFAEFFGRYKTDRYIVHGNELKKQLIANYHISEDRVDVVPLGGMSPFRKLGKGNQVEEENTILFFGRIWKYKGLKYLIEAEPLISKQVPNLKIIIAGTGEDISWFREGYDKEKFVLKNYRIPITEVSTLFMRSSIVVLPYIEASQSGIIPLAFSLSKPVIATTVGSIPELVKQDYNGLLVKPKDVQGLADAVIWLLQNTDVRKKFGENAKKYYIEELSMSILSPKTIAVYNKAIKDKLKF